MLCKANILEGYTLNSLNGKIGEVNEFYFDDRRWTIRYLVADTGNWLTDRQVLISPYALVDVDMKEQLIAINLTQKQIEDSPSLESEAGLATIRGGLLRILWLADVFERAAYLGVFSLHCA